MAVVPDLDEVLDVNEAAASEGGLREGRDDDLLPPLCMFAGLHPRPLHLGDGAHVHEGPLAPIGHFLLL